LESVSFSLESSCWHVQSWVEDKRMPGVRTLSAVEIALDY
jgi:hypothetical protein